MKLLCLKILNYIQNNCLSSAVDEMSYKTVKG